MNHKLPLTAPRQAHGFCGPFLYHSICLPVNPISFKGRVNSLTSTHPFSAVDGAFMERWRWREGECLLAIRYQSIRRRCSGLTCSCRSTLQPPTWIISANHVLFLFPFWPLVRALRCSGFNLAVHVYIREHRLTCDISTRHGNTVV